MRKYILFIALIMQIGNMFGQAIGSWKAYPALQISTYNVPAGDKIYSLCDGNLFSYNTKDTEVYIYDRINTLNDSQIAFIEYSEAQNVLVCVYSNGNVDLLYDDNSVTNLSQLKESNYSSLIIRNLSISESEAYLSTNFGIVVIDLKKEEFKNTYNLNMNVICCIRHENVVYMSTDEGCYIGKLSLNLLDKSNWERVSNFVFHDIAIYKNELFCIFNNIGLYHLDKNLSYTKVLDKPTFLTINKDKMIAGNSGNIYIFDTPDSYQTIVQENKFNCLSYKSGLYWASQKMDGLQAYKLNENSLVPNGTKIQPNSPVRDYFCNMNYTGNRLLVAGGTHNYTGKIYEGTAMYYDNGTWYYFEEEGIQEATNLTYRNLTSIAQDPSDDTHHYVSSAEHGVYEFKNFKFVKKYDYTNSTLKTVLPESVNPLNYVRCTALIYDKDGNLWMSNNEVNTIINILKKDGKWTSLYYPEIDAADVCDVIMFDSKDRLWLTSRRMENAGVFFLDYNGTIETTDDDTHRLRTTITNQDGITYNPDEFYTIAEDLEGKIWIGTNLGPFVINNPDEFINNDFTYEQVKIPRNDGTDYADYLLSGIPITAIAIDAANRKWFGTSGNGVYLISEDGKEMLQHFTEDNSPLLSNSIQDIVVHPQSGEVMIGTTKGLVSYMSDANTPKETLQKSNIHAFPNPVTPDYNGLISVTGLTENAEVKITNSTGQLIYAGHSNGGLFTWDGTTTNGKRVASGVYNVIANTEDGKKAIVTRITIIR